MTEKKAAIVLAAGKGKRMKSDRAKVLHEVNGRPMICRVLDTLNAVNFEKIVVVIGYQGEQVQEALADYVVEFAWQHEQLGTGHAVMMTENLMRDFDGTTLVALGDVPFLSVGSIKRLLETHRQTEASATCLSAVVDDASGYGRIIRKGDSSILLDIIEHRDADEEIRRIGEFNTGTFCFDNRALFTALSELGNDNSQQEFYLTDCIKIMRNKSLVTSVVAADNADEVEGVNSIEQLERLARLFSDRG
ncbi:MAG: NTP transferase domain-containing protein [candidate division Zixibacteria bacterium]|nr:NTP transferase domain-containing protein [candidate division Zixibacteria bacterium]